MTVKLDIFCIVRILIWWNTWKYNNRCSFGNSLAFLALHLPQHVISSGLVSPKKQQDWNSNQKESFTFTFTENLIFLSTIVVQWNMAGYLKGTYYWTYTYFSHTRDHACGRKGPISLVPVIWFVSLPGAYGFAKTTMLNQESPHLTWNTMLRSCDKLKKTLSNHTDFGGPAFNFAIISM